MCNCGRKRVNKIAIQNEKDAEKFVLQAKELIKIKQPQLN